MRINIILFILHHLTSYILPLLFSGWKDNPVNFDSLFNQSYKTWSWGSPDILNIFKKQQSNNNFYPFSYNSNEIDFASSDPSLLDKWVFEHVQKFLTESKRSEDMYKDLQQPKTVFFLHLLGEYFLFVHEMNVFVDFFHLLLCIIYTLKCFNG